MIDVVIADDRAETRERLRVLIDAQDDMRVVAEAATVTEIAAIALEYLPDIVLVAHPPGLDPAVVTGQTKGHRATSAIPVVLADPDPVTIAGAVRRAAAGQATPADQETG